MKFTKIHGTGNDFIMIDNLNGAITLAPEQIRHLCDRHFGIGADAIILVEKGRHGEEAFMNYWNADGTVAEMCGNGARCVAHYMRQYKDFSKDSLALDTRAGVKDIDLLKNGLFRVNMGAPISSQPSDFPDASQSFGGHTFHFVSMGNPHAVTLVNNEKEAIHIMNTLAPEIEVNQKFFPNRINVSMAWSKEPNHFGAKTHERGVGPTLACGTGMSATFAVLAKNGITTGKEPVQIEVPGGTLFFEYNAKEEILMTGSSKIVFSGEIR